MSDSKINMNNFEDILESLTEKKLRVCVVGIGRIGLPTALSFAKSGLETIGVDTVSYTHLTLPTILLV